MALINYFTDQAVPNQQTLGLQQFGSAPAPAPSTNANEMVTGSLQAMLDPNSSYIQNARQRGIEQAATRGGVNSSIAAGASERAAIEAAAPLAQQALSIQSSREDANTQNWLSQQNFGRALFGQTFSNSMGMLNAIQQYALEDPELYTPEVTSGYTNFFQQNMNDLLSRYFGG